MTNKEKIGKLSQNIYGWKIFKNYKTTKVLENEINKYGKVGYIYGILRSDPWSGIDYKNGIKGPNATGVLNRIQEEIIQKTGEPSLFVEEAPHGHQGLDSTTLPVNLAVGASFNKKLYEKNLSNVAKEIRFKGAHVALLSCLDLALDPRWGRSEECFGEDTYLSMQMTKHAIYGLQGKRENIPFDKVAVIAKHLIGQGSAFGGHNGKSVSMGWNELKMHHIPIAIEATKQKVAGFMMAYNDIDNIPCHTNKKLINYIKKQNNFKGIFMSDGCAIDNIMDYTSESTDAISQSINAGVGVDLWNETFNSFEKALKDGGIDEKSFNDAIARTDALRKRLGIMDKPYQEVSLYKGINFRKHKEDNLELAEESLVLLKNDGQLPLKNLDKTCLIGWHAKNVYNQLGDYTPFQNLDKTLSIKDVFQINYHEGTHARVSEPSKIKEASIFASKYKNVILILGTSSARDFDTVFNKNGEASIEGHRILDMDCGEGADVADVRISRAQIELFNAIKSKGVNIITVINSGRALGIGEILEGSKAVIQMFYAGSEGSIALKNTILGKNNPSGKLPVSLPRTSNQLPIYYWLPKTKTYVDEQSSPLFEFGYGMSYSKIEQKIININSQSLKKHSVNVRISNKSQRTAKHTVLIFAKIFNTIKVPPSKQLVAFEKIEIEGNSEIKIKIQVDMRWIYKNYNYKNVEFELG